MKNAYLAALLRTDQTVFTFKELLLIWNETDTDLVKKRLYRYVKNGTLYKIRRGIYAKDKNYDRLEFANKLYTPSYISLETILAREGVIFQHYDSMFVVSYLSREISCDGQTYVFRKIKDTVLSCDAGLVNNENYFTANRERAFLDTLYLYRSYHFDNLAGINWDRCFEMVPLYRNAALEKRLKLYQRWEENV